MSAIWAVAHISCGGIKSGALTHSLTFSSLLKLARKIWSFLLLGVRVWVLFVISTAFLAFPLFSFILYPLLRAVGITVHSTFYSPLPPPPPSPVQLPDALTHHQQKTVSFTFTFIACHFERAFERTNAKIFLFFCWKATHIASGLERGLNGKPKGGRKGN